MRKISMYFACFFILIVMGCGNESGDPTARITLMADSTTVATAGSADSTTVAPGGSAVITATVIKAVAPTTTTTTTTTTGTTTTTTTTSSGWGENVTFRLLTANGAQLSVPTQKTDGDGKARTVYTAGNNYNEDVIQATLDNGMSASIVIKKTGSLIGARIFTLVASPTSVAEGQTAVITATVTDGNSTSNPLMGEAVTFTIATNESGACFINATNACVTGVTVNSDAGGNAVAVYKAGGNSSLTAVYDTVRSALANGSSNAVVITRSAETPLTDLSVSVTASPTSVNDGQTSIITATVTGDDRSGAAVTFSLPVNSSGASFINSSGSSVSSITVTASGSGIATAIYQAGSTSSGTTVQDTVQAVLTNGANGAVIITQTGIITTTYTMSIGASATSVTAGQVSVITATVKSGSTAAGGVTVTFTLPVNSSGATLSAATATTDGSGNAVVTYQPGTTSPTVSVQDTVKAAVGTATSAVAITRTGSSTSAFSITVSASDATLTADGSSSVITANVENNAGIAISGVTVNFAVTGVVPLGTLSVASAKTDGSGNAVTTFTGNGVGATGATSVVTASITVSGNTYTDAVVITYP